MNQIVSSDLIRHSAERPGFQQEGNQERVAVEWLRQNIGQRWLRIIDVCDRRAFHQRGIIPGAIVLDTEDGQLRSSEPLAQILEFAAVMSQHGVGDEHVIVVYDEGNEQRASKLCRKLKRYGHGQALMLNGGRAAWVAAAGELTKATSRPPPTSFTVRNLDGISLQSRQDRASANVRKTGFAFPPKRYG